MSWVTKITGVPASRRRSVDEAGHGALAGQVEREQGLVAEQDAGVADEGLGNAEALLLAARGRADRRAA